MVLKLINRYQPQNLINPILKYVNTVRTYAKMHTSRPIILQFPIIVENTLKINSIQIMFNFVTYDRS